MEPALRNLTGIAGAMPRALRALLDGMGAREIDHLWIFPPLSRGRTDRGLLVASCFEAEGARRRVFTLAYTAERTSAGVSLESRLAEEALVPPDRLHRVIAGVIERSGLELDGPEDFAIEGEPGRLEELIEGFETVEREAP